MKSLRARLYDYCHENGAISDTRPTIVQIRLDRLHLFIEKELKNTKRDEYGHALSYMEGWKYRGDYTKNFQLRNEPKSH